MTPEVGGAAASRRAPDERPAARRRLPVLYPSVLAMSWIAMFYVLAGISPLPALRLLVLFGLGTLVVTVVAGLTMGDADRGASLSLAVVALLTVGKSPASAVFIGLWIALILADRLIGDRHGWLIPWRRLSSVGSALALIVVCAIAIKAVQTGTVGRLGRDLSAELHWPAGQVGPVTAAVAATNARPDIYVLLLDGYGRADKLESLFGYDNRPFLAELESRGFAVSDRSRSNYLATDVSLASMLNMEHLVGRGRSDARADVELRWLIEDNRAFAFLRGLGYRISAVDSGFEMVALRTADTFIDTGELNEFEQVVLRESGIGWVVTSTAPDFVAGELRRRIRHGLDEAVDIATTSSGPSRFVFVHIPAPHPPWVFDADGRDTRLAAGDEPFTALDDRRIARAEYGANYTAEIAYLNGLVVDAISKIQASSARPPVILVFGDHGSASDLDWADLVHSDLDERTANLFAAATPGHPDLFGEAPTLVNVFPTLFDAYLGGSFPLQPDVSYRFAGSQFDLLPIPLPEDGS